MPSIFAMSRDFSVSADNVASFRRYGLEVSSHHAGHAHRKIWPLTIRFRDYLSPLMRFSTFLGVAPVILSDDSCKKRKTKPSVRPWRARFATPMPHFRASLRQLRAPNECFFRFRAILISPPASAEEAQNISRCSNSPAKCRQYAEC